MVLRARQLPSCSRSNNTTSGHYCLHLLRDVFAKNACYGSCSSSNSRAAVRACEVPSKLCKPSMPTRSTSLLGPAPGTWHLAAASGYFVFVRVLVRHLTNVGISSACVLDCLDHLASHLGRLVKAWREEVCECRQACSLYNYFGSSQLDHKRCRDAHVTACAEVQT